MAAVTDRHVKHPKTEAEWDQWVREHGTQFLQCHWLAIHHPAPHRKTAP